MTVTVFPAAAPTVRGLGHPRDCACRACTDRDVAAIRRPLVPPGPRTDPALTNRGQR